MIAMPHLAKVRNFGKGYSRHIQKPLRLEYNISGCFIIGWKNFSIESKRIKNQLPFFIRWVKYTEY